MTVIFYTTAQTWLSSLDAAGRAAGLTAFALPVTYFFFFFFDYYYYRSSSCLNILYVSSAENISSHEFCCFSDRVHPVSEQSFPKFEFGSPSVPALNKRKRRKTEKKPKLSEVHMLSQLFDSWKVIQESPENCPKSISFALLTCSQFSSKSLDFNNTVVLIWFVFVHPSALTSPISIF